MVMNLATAAGLTMTYDSFLQGGYTLQKHANSATALNKIKQGNWDIVVLPEQSQIPSISTGAVCFYSTPYAQQLVQNIQQYNPNAKVLLLKLFAKDHSIWDVV